MTDERLDRLDAPHQPDDAEDCLVCGEPWPCIDGYDAAVRERDELRAAIDGLDWDDIRHGSPVSDYWTGWNDGITKAAGHLRDALHREAGA